MSRARLVLVLVLTLVLGGVTSAIAQVATPAPEATEGAGCGEGEDCGSEVGGSADEEVAEEPAEEPVVEDESGEEASAEEPAEVETAEETVLDVERQTASASKTAERAVMTLADVNVEVVDSDFNPGSITIAPGDTVVWTFQGEQPHTVTADDGSFDSGEMTSGEFSMRFDEVGTYRYFCELHGAAGGEGMSGIVIVEGNGASEQPPSAEPGGSEEGDVAGEETAKGNLPRTGGGPPPGWVFAIALLFSGIVLWRVARLAEIL